MRRSVRFGLISGAAALTLSTPFVANASVAKPSQPMAVKAASASTLLPTKDAFYRYTGDKPLKDYAPGSVLKSRSISIALGANATPVPAYQVLYRTNNELKKPSVTVSTIITPTTAVAIPRVMEYLSFYDALGAECDPSFTLRGGYAGNSANEQQAELEEGIISAYLADGDTMTVPDFEGEHLDWDAGQESGYDSLDAIRATENFLKLKQATTPVAITGYSGGSIGGEWASELAPKYAPKLDLVGVAEGGIPVDQWHNVKYINGSTVWSGVIPAVLVSESRAFHIKDLDKYLSAYGRKVAHQVSDECIGSFNGNYPGLKIQKLLKPKYQDYKKITFFRKIVNKMVMGSTPGHPKGPLYMAVGDSDGTGDGVMVTKDVEGLAHEYCKQGVTVQFNVEQGDAHTEAAIPFEEKALSWVQARLDGVPAAGDTCSSIGHGNTLNQIH